MKTLFGIVFLIVVGLQGCAEPPKQTKFSFFWAQHIYKLQAIQQKIVYSSIGDSNRNSIKHNNYYHFDEIPYISFAGETQSEEPKGLQVYQVENMQIYACERLDRYWAPFRQIYFMYHLENHRHYYWWPIDWSAYVLKDESNIQNLYNHSIDTNYHMYSARRGGYYPGYFKEAEPDGFVMDSLEAVRPLDWNVYGDIYDIYTAKNGSPMTKYSVKNTYHFNMLADIIRQMDSPEAIDTMLIFCHNQCNYQEITSNARYVYLLDTLDEEKHLWLLRDTCDWLFMEHLEPRNTEYSPAYNQAVLNVFERLDIADLENIVLLYPDLSREKISNIVEYAKQTKPSYIYFKRGHRGIFSKEIYYYFLFYYVDFMPFCAPKLRDLEVVFPRRFGIR